MLTKQLILFYLYLKLFHTILPPLLHKISRYDNIYIEPQSIIAECKDYMKQGDYRITYGNALQKV